MVKYKLLTTDMDDTLLDFYKHISSRNVEAITKALDMDKYIVFATGRSLGELEEFIGYFPKMRYAICMNGAYICDLLEQKVLYEKRLDERLVRKLLYYADKKDIMLQVHSGEKCIMCREQIMRLSDYGMERYLEHFIRTGYLVDNVIDTLIRMEWKVGKINMFHKSSKQREDTLAEFSNIPAEVVLAERTSLEFSPPSTNKGTGLEFLCQYLGISLEETISVGDSFNDLSILGKAGLSVAVGNAVSEVKAVCMKTVSDCDHSGVAEAVDCFLLA